MVSSPRAHPQSLLRDSPWGRLPGWSPDPAPGLLLAHSLPVLAAPARLSSPWSACATLTWVSHLKTHFHTLASHQTLLMAPHWLQRDSGFPSRPNPALPNGIPAPLAPAGTLCPCTSGPLTLLTHPAPLPVSSHPNTPSALTQSFLLLAQRQSRSPPPPAPRDVFSPSLECSRGLEQALTCHLCRTCLPSPYSENPLWEPPRGVMAVPPAHPLLAAITGLGPESHRTHELSVGDFSSWGRFYPPSC